MAPHSRASIETWPSACSFVVLADDVAPVPEEVLGVVVDVLFSVLVEVGVVSGVLVDAVGDVVATAPLPVDCCVVEVPVPESVLVAVVLAVAPPSPRTDDVSLAVPVGIVGVVVLVPSVVLAVLVPTVDMLPSPEDGEDVALFEDAAPEVVLGDDEAADDVAEIMVVGVVVLPNGRMYAEFSVVKS